MKFKREVRVGLFAAVTIAIIVFVTIRVGDQSVVSGGALELNAVFENAAGLYPKAAVEISGVTVGRVKKVGLTQDGKASVRIAIDDKVHLSQNSRAFLRSRGFLGESYVEVMPGDQNLPPLENGALIRHSESGGDVSEMIDQFNSIGRDVKDMTVTMKRWLSKEDNGPIASAVDNFNQFAKIMRDVSVRNEQNMNRILENMADLTHEIKMMVHDSKNNATEAVERVASITQKIDEGRGTIGKLINDPDTVEKLNNSLDNLSDAIGGFRQMELGLGFHTEYLKRSHDFKNYVSLNLSPTPNTSVLVDFVADPSPDTSRSTKTSTVKAGGSSTTVTTDTETLQRDATLFSAQIARKFYDFTFRGGIIESKGGVGLDYDRGMVGLSFSAFDFETDFNEQPHLKFMGALNMTQNFYLLGGVDDPLNPAQKTDYFFGAGLRFVDNDIKSLLGLASMKPK